ncbi:hypothetical protein KY360_02670 [Candidatus Woesearchaeota archaeon]|nr:hypothetical protein [Candidatus Woesearchaeota archaeon]
MKYTILLSLLSIIIISGCYAEKLNEGDIYIDRIEIVNQRSCEEIEAAMETSELARLDGYKTMAEVYTYVSPIEESSGQDYACIILREDQYDMYKKTGKLGYTGWKPGLNKAESLLGLELDKTTKVYFCCYIVDENGEKISNDLCSEKTFEKVC